MSMRYEVCDVCPRDVCTEDIEDCTNPCMSCCMEPYCCNENTDKRDECAAYIKFKGTMNV